MRKQTPEIAPPDHPQELLPPPPGTADPGAAPKEKEKEEKKAESGEQPPTGSKHRWIYILLLLLLAAAAVYWFSSRGKPADQTSTAGKKGGGRGSAPAVTPVVATEAKKGNIGVYVTGLGAITPIYTVTVRSRVDGELVSIHFKEGDFVRRGDPLIDIDPRPYTAVVEQTQGQLIRDKALLANAHVDLARYQTLLAQDAIPEQQLATQKALVTQYEGTVINDQGLLDAAKLNVTYCHITSPLTGVVGLRLVDPGNIVHAADTSGMLLITEVQPISVIFTISEDQMQPILQKLKARQKLTVEAWDRALRNKLATGTLDTLDNLIDQTTGTLKLRALFNNSERTLFPNQFVNARLLQQMKTGVTLLPSAAVQRNTNNTYVYLINPDNTVAIRSIKTGTTEGDQSEITSGLAPGDKVVMTGVDKLIEGSKVSPTMQGAPESAAPSSPTPAQAPTPAGK